MSGILGAPFGVMIFWQWVRNSEANSLISSLTESAMALFCSQEAVIIARWFIQPTNDQHSRNLRGLDYLKQVLYARFDWAQLLLLLEYSAEFPFIVAYHPWAPTRDARDPLQTPNDMAILGQVLVFCFVDCAVYQFFVRYYPLFSAEGSTSAYGIATEFTVSRTILLLAIAIIQSPTLLGFASPLSEIHFISVLGWMWLRRVLE